MEAPIRVLEIVTNMARGGIETMLMNYDRNIDQSAVQLDFLVHRAERAVYDDEIEALGGRIYRVPRLNPISPAYHKSLIDFFRLIGNIKWYIVIWTAWREFRCRLLYIAVFRCGSPTLTVATSLKIFVIRSR